jgi:hypothetical protein
MVVRETNTCTRGVVSDSIAIALVISGWLLWRARAFATRSQSHFLVAILALILLEVT